MQIPYLYAEVDGVQSLTLFLGGVPTPIDSTHPAFKEIFENIDTITPNEVRNLMDTKKRVRRMLAQFGNVKVEDGVVTYKGEVVNGQLADRMVRMLDDGLDVRPWALFLENLKKNPAKHAVDELFGWLEHSNMPITERGNFLAYKKVKDDYTSYHSNPDGTPFRNDIGTFVSMDRNKVDDNRNRTCSSGLHFCSWDYLSSYMGNQGKVVILEINPAHVVSIPTDYNNAKGRAEGYLIVGEIPQEFAKSAFPGLAYVGYDDSEYITHRQTDEIDYSDIDDGWFNGDYVDDLDDIDEACEEANSMGYQEGYDHAYKYDFAYDPELSEWDFTFDEEYGAYCDGYSDGFYDGTRDREDEEEVLESQPKSSKFSWTIEDVVDDITNDKLTLNEFVREYDPEQWALIEVLDRI